MNAIENGPFHEGVEPPVSGHRGQPDPRDDRVEQAYQELGQEEPPEAVDLAVRAMASDALAADADDDSGVAPERGSTRPRWLLPAAAAAVAVVVIVALLAVVGSESAPSTVAPNAAPSTASAVSAASTATSNQSVDPADGAASLVDDLPAASPAAEDDQSSAAEMPADGATGVMADLERVIPLIPDLPAAGSDAAGGRGAPADEALQKLLHLYGTGDFAAAATVLSEFRAAFPMHPVSELLAVLIDEPVDEPVGEAVAVDAVSDAPVDAVTEDLDVVVDAESGDLEVPVTPLPSRPLP